LLGKQTKNRENITYISKNNKNRLEKFLTLLGNAILPILDLISSPLLLGDDLIVLARKKINSFFS